MSKLRESPWRYLIWTAISLVLLLMAALATVSTFLATEGGSRVVAEWGLQRLAEVDGVEVSAQNIRGNLLQGLQLSGVSIQTPQAAVQAQSILASWNSFSLLSGSFQLASLQLQGIEVTVRQTGESSTNSPATSPVAELAFTPLPINIEIADLSVSDLRIVIEADQGEESQSVAIAELAAGVSLFGTAVALDELAIVSDLVKLNGDVAVELLPGVPVTADLRWELPQSLPQGLGNAVGELSLAATVEQLQVDHQLTSPFAIRSTGSIQPFAASGIAIELEHRAEQIELPEQASGMQLLETTLVSSGSIPDLQFQLTTRVVEGEQYPALAISASAQLTGQTLGLDSAIRTDSGVLDSTATIDFSQEITVQGDFTLQEDNPLLLFGLASEFPVSALNSRGEFAFDADDSSLLLDLAETTMLLDSYEVTAAGRLALNDGAWEIDDFLVSSAANQFQVSGRYDESIALDFVLDAPQLEQFVPGVSATAIGQGTVRGNLEAPIIDTDIRIEQLVSEAATIDSLQVSLTGDPQHYEGQVLLQSGQFRAGSETLQITESSMEFSGSPAAHELLLALQGDYLGSGLTADIELQGGFADALGSDWSGRLQRSALQSVVGDWSLVSPVALTWIDQQFTAADSCWANAGISLCMNATPDPSGSYAIEGSISDFPLQEFNAPEQRDVLIPFPQLPRVPQGVSLDGTATATVYAEISATGELRLNVSTLADNAVLTLSSAAEDQFGAQRSAEEILEQSYTWRRLSLRADLVEGEWLLDGRAQLETANLQDDSLPISGELLANLNIDADGNLQGRSTAEFSDLGWLSAVVPELRDVSGLFDSRVDIAGTLAAPELNGELRVNEAAFFLETNGVAYSDFEMSLSGASIDSVTLEGSVAAEEGYLTYFGSLRGLNTPDWQITAEVEGDSFWIANTPEIALQIAPALNLDANAQRIDLRGNLHVPLLDLVLQELPESAVDISRDVVIQNYPSERPELARSFTSTQTALFDLPMSADLVLSLGDEVAFSGFGLQASLQGELELQQQLTGASFTYGELAITEGQYRIYGQELTLQDGKLLFLGNYSNPALDIRAVRVVQEQTVGVLINGTLNNMRSQLYSTPVLPESDILAVLVTGRPASQLRSSDGDAMLGAIASLGIEQGQSLADDLGNRFGFDTVAITNTGDIDSSELTVGKYLTPQIFIRYGVGLFDSFSKVAVDYFINDRLTLQAESGEYQSIDFTYRVER